MKRPTCFISYCHDDAPHELIAIFRAELEAQARHPIQILFDKSLPPGADFIEFMDSLLDNTDLALLLLTPGYKSRAVDRKGGVYYEYSRIVYRSTQSLPQKHPVRIIPVILSGTYETSLPSEIKNLKAVDLRSIHVIKDKTGALVAPDHQKSTLRSEIQSILRQLYTLAAIDTEAYQKDLKHYYSQLFLDTKTNRSTYSKTDLHSSVFIRTRAFDAIEGQNRFFVIGRKGSGKSTLATALEHLGKDRYKGCILVRADQIDLRQPYSGLSSSIRADLDSTLNKQRFFEYAWQGFLLLCSIEHIGRLATTNQLSVGQLKHAATIEAFLKDFRRGQQVPTLKDVFFAYSSEKLQEFIEDIIRISGTRGTQADFLAEIRVRMNLKAYLEYLVGAPTLLSMVQIVGACDKRVLLTVDDFDTIFDTFRREVINHEEELKKRADFETSWLRALLILVMNLKEDRDDELGLFRNIDFCITIPKDRYLEIERSDRDGYRYANRACNLLWSGIDLCEMLVARLQKTENLQVSSELKPHEKLSWIMENAYPSIPQEIEFEFNSKKIRIPLFLYVLRHTFWRPRDIIMFYGAIFAGVKNVSHFGDKISDSVIRRIISEQTYQILRTEFLDEYGSTVPNLRKIVNKFVGKRQVMSLDELQRELGGAELWLNDHHQLAEGQIEPLHAQLEVLFDLGFLGLQVSHRIKSALNLATHDVFYFTEGRSAFRACSKLGFTDCHFIIHPLFAENLILDYSANDFVLNLSWDYAYKNHEAITVIGN